MKTRTLKAVKAAITKTEKEVASLRVELPKAKSKVIDIKVKREAVVYKAKIGNPSAQAKLSKLNEQLDTASVEMEDFSTAIKQGEAKLQTLEVELSSAKQATGRELIRDYGEKQEESLARIDKAMGEITDAVKNSQGAMAELRKELSNLDFKELNLEHKLTRVTVGFISSALYLLFPRHFERSIHKAYRNKPLVEMAKVLFTAVAESQGHLLEDPNEGVIRADLSEGFRVVSDAEIMERQARADEMKQDASRLRGVGVPA